MKSTSTLGFKLVVLFMIFLLLILGGCGLVTYMNQMSIYRDQCETDVRNVGEYLEDLIQMDGKDFARYQKYYLGHFHEVNIPIDADEYVTYQKDFEKAFKKYHPGKTLDADIDFEDLNENVQRAYFKYRHLYWLLTFEKAREDFDLPYTYYLVPDSETHNVIYMIDGERTSRAKHLKILEESPEYKPFDHPQGDEEEYMYLSDEYHNDRDKYAVEWDTWETGKEQDGFQIWKNQWGDTYAYYVPVIINGEKIGLVGTEVEIAKVNKGILQNTVRQFLVVGLILLIGMLILVLFINRSYIRRIAELEANVQLFARTKDASVADKIREGLRGENEITSLSRQVAQMIDEIRNYITSLGVVNEQLDQANVNVARMSELALTDGLTGIRNMTAYQQEMDWMEEKLEKEPMEFAIAMVDLNDLKKINDTYGHEKGNKTIISLSKIICDMFQHSKVYRIGGDEFAAILLNEDYRNRDALVEEFCSLFERMRADENLQSWERISAAIGMAVYDPEEDSRVNDVFRRADVLMYENKKRMKNAIDKSVPEA